MGFFSKIKNAVSGFAQSFTYKLSKLFGANELDDDFFDELEEILLTADVGSKTTQEVLERLRDVIDNKHLKTPTEAKPELKRILRDIIDFDVPELEYPLVVMVAGVNGVGKTTTVGKLANYFKSLGKNVTIVAGDTFRAAAADQLTVWAERASVRIVKQNEGADAASVVYDAIQSAKSKGVDVLIVDTAGRLHNKINLMEELKKIDRIIDREYPEAMRQNYIVLDATTGQNAISQVDIFNEAIDIDGIVLTKLDGTAKGGVVFAIAGEEEVPVVFVGVGEGINDLERFDVDNFISSIVE